MRYTLLFIALLTSLSQICQAQKAQRFNYGAKGGFSSTIYSIDQLSISGHEITDFTPNSEVSWFGSLFLRMNIKRHYLQTDCSFANSRYSISFPTTQWNSYARNTDKSTINTTLKCLEIPICYGYQIQKEGYYCMSIFAGPKLAFILPGQSRHTFENFTQNSITEAVHTANASAVAGFCIQIRDVFFDCTGEAGLNDISSHFTSIGTNGKTYKDDIIFHRHKNGISFSIGFIL